jgi:hypothetical protein
MIKTVKQALQGYLNANTIYLWDASVTPRCFVNIYSAVAENHYISSTRTNERIQIEFSVELNDPSLDLIDGELLDAKDLIQSKLKLIENSIVVLPGVDLKNLRYLKWNKSIKVDGTSTEAQRYQGTTILIYEAFLAGFSQ